jgi:hypothetical protein
MSKVTKLPLEVLEEKAKSPAGKHDDQVDALGLIGQLLDRMGKGTPLPGIDQKPRFIFCRDIGGRLESISLAHRGPKKDQRGGEAERGAPRMQSGPILD